MAAPQLMVWATMNDDEHEKMNKFQKLHPVLSFSFIKVGFFIWFTILHCLFTYSLLLSSLGTLLFFFFFSFPDSTFLSSKDEDSINTNPDVMKDSFSVIGSI